MATCCNRCGRPTATQKDWDEHEPGCECEHCRSLCWDSTACEDTRDARLAALESALATERSARIAAESRLADYGRGCRCDGCARSGQAECPSVGAAHALAAAEERARVLTEERDAARRDYCEQYCGCGDVGGCQRERDEAARRGWSYLYDREGE